MEAAAGATMTSLPNKRPASRAAAASLPGTHHQELATTKLVGGSMAISQEVFTRVISRAGSSQQDVSSLFDFYRPVKRPSALASSILRLTDKQHDVLYALSGCSDVACTMSRVDKKTRKALLHIYGIDKQQFSTWFKNRRPKPRKDGTRRELPAGAAPAPLTSQAELDDLHDGSPDAAGGSSAGSLTGAGLRADVEAAAPLSPACDAGPTSFGATSHAQVQATAGSDRKRRVSASSFHDPAPPAKSARSPCSPGGADAFPADAFLPGLPDGSPEPLLQHVSSAPAALVTSGCDPLSVAQGAAGRPLMRSLSSVLEVPSLHPDPCAFPGSHARPVAHHHHHHHHHHQHQHQHAQGHNQQQQQQQDCAPSLDPCPAPAPRPAPHNHHHQAYQHAAGPAAFPGPETRGTAAPGHAASPLYRAPPPVPHPQPWEALPPAYAPSDWLEDFPEWPESPSGSEDATPSFLFLSQSAIAAVAAEAAAAAEEASGLSPLPMALPSPLPSQAPPARQRPSHAGSSAGGAVTGAPPAWGHPYGPTTGHMAFAPPAKAQSYDPAYCPSPPAAPSAGGMHPEAAHRPHGSWYPPRPCASGFPRPHAGCAYPPPALHPAWSHPNRPRRALPPRAHPGMVVSGTPHFNDRHRAACMGAPLPSRMSAPGHWAAPSPDARYYAPPHAPVHHYAYPPYDWPYGPAPPMPGSLRPHHWSGDYMGIAPSSDFDATEGGCPTHQGCEGDEALLMESGVKVEAGSPGLQAGPEGSACRGASEGGNPAAGPGPGAAGDAGAAAQQQHQQHQQHQQQRFAMRMGQGLGSSADLAALCSSPSSWGMVHQQRVRKGPLPAPGGGGQAPSAQFPSGAEGAWQSSDVGGAGDPSGGVGALDVFDLNSFGFLDEL